MTALRARPGRQARPATASGTVVNADAGRGATRRSTGAEAGIGDGIQ